jgi:hypothetical protein
MTAAIAVEKSSNAKVGDVSVTLASQASCPSICPFRGSGCYAESGPMALHTNRLNSDPITSSIAIAQQEAAAIRNLSGKRHLRLHTVGDCRTDRAARIVALAAAEFSAKHGKVAWSYTHSWRTVSRKSWMQVSVLASCETMQDIQEAQDRGYATAIVVEHHPENGRAYKVGEQTIIPCPQQTRENVTCASCGLCRRDGDLLARKQTIAFAVHGAGKKRAVKGLEGRNAGE